MGEILSQAEVEALLKAVDAGSLPVAEPNQGGGVRAVDLTNQERSLRGRLPGLDVVLGRLTRDLQSSLATFFGQVPHVACTVAELVKLSSFMERLAQPVGLQLFRLTPLRGQGMLVLRAPLLTAVLQVVFGGMPGRKAAPLAREFSALEQRVLERVGQRVLADVREAWRAVAPLECGYLRTETNPLFAAIASPQELVLHVELAIAAEGHEEVSLAVCIPNASLDPLRGALARVQQGVDAGSDPAGDTAWRTKLHAALAEAPVELGVELGRREMRMREVLGLAVGDVVTLGTGREGPALVRVAGRPHFVGTPGVSGGNNAVRVTARL